MSDSVVATVTSQGLIPDMGCTIVLPELIPKDVAMELTMVGGPDSLLPV